MRGQQPDVAGPFPQRRHAHLQHVEPIEEILTEGSAGYRIGERVAALEGADDAVAFASGLGKEAVPCADKVRFVSAGSEATFYAMRIARAHRGRDKILKFEGGFHGMSDYALMSMAVGEAHVLNLCVAPEHQRQGIAEFIKREEALGAVVVSDARVNPAEHKKFVEAEINKWGPVIRANVQYAD